PLRCCTGTSEDVRHGSPPHAGEGVIRSATPLACRGPHRRLGRVPPGSCTPGAWTGQRPAEALQGSQGLVAVVGHRWRRGVADASDNPARLCSSHLLLRATGYALRISSGAPPAPWLVRVMRRGAVADRCDVNKLHAIYLTKKNHSNRLLILR